MEKLRKRSEEWERAVQAIDRRAKQEQVKCTALERLEAFRDRVAVGLGTMPFEERQAFLRLVVERIAVDNR